jgi:histone deacetylase 1/2
LIAFQTDNDKEFDNHALRSFFNTHGIAFRLSCPYTSQQNGKAERILRTVSAACSSMPVCPAPTGLRLWPRPRTSSIASHASPVAHPHPTSYCLANPPSYNHLRVFGCLCFPNQAATAPNKLSARSVPCAFLGYPSDHLGYRCLDLQTCSVITSRHVTFDETQFPFHSAQLQPLAPTAGPEPVYDKTVLIPTTAIRTVPPSPPVQTATISPPKFLHCHPKQMIHQRLLPLHSSRRPLSAVPAQQASPSAPAGAHHMITRAKASIHKPNPRYALTTVGAKISPIPTSARDALKDPNW